MQELEEHNSDNHLTTLFRHSLNLKDANNTLFLDIYSEIIHNQLWTRFISPHGIVYDYAGSNGEIVLPTLEECKNSKPNALGWMTPVENGAFFTGVYLLGRCDEYLQNPNKKSAMEIRRLVGGLYKLQDVCKTPGMIARGVGSDEQCHYYCSSNDQNIPWLLSLWRYMSTDIPNHEEKRECKERLIRHIKALKDANWKFPGDHEGFERNSMLEDEGLEGSLSSVHLAITIRIFVDLAPETMGLYEKILEEKLSNGKTRLDIIGEGFTNYKSHQGWYTSTAQYAVRELFRLENNLQRKEVFKKALDHTANAAAESISCYHHFTNKRSANFNPDWHFLMSAWTPQQCTADAVKTASVEGQLWRQYCSAVEEDKLFMMAPLTAAWIVLLSANEKLIKTWHQEIITALQHFDYTCLYFSAFFYGENVIGELRKHIQVEQ